MDRAHRLGQRRVVNVHRLIMRGTLEEKVMSLQRFKLSVANTIITAENASLNSMDTTQLLDLFTVSANSGKVRFRVLYDFVNCLTAKTYQVRTPVKWIHLSSQSIIVLLLISRLVLRRRVEMKKQMELQLPMRQAVAGV